MVKNSDKVKDFFKALNQGDYKSANELYHPNAIYEDEIFSFKGFEIHALWYTATRPGMDMSADCISIEEVGDKVICIWKMSYTIDSINRKIELQEKATFFFDGDKVIKHIDEYDFWSWCIQAFGLPGRLFGWSKWLRNRVRFQAKKSVLANLYTVQGATMK